jgi:hypothetical protein
MEEYSYLFYLSPLNYHGSNETNADLSTDGYSPATTDCTSIFTTTAGFLGKGSSKAEPGDKIAILFGCRTPFIVRREADHFILIGECFVHGLMNGEATTSIDDSRVESLKLW